MTTPATPAASTPATEPTTTTVTAPGREAPRPTVGDDLDRTARPSEPAVALRSLVKTFRGAEGTVVRAVDGLDVTIQPGEVVALLGPNGAGKTTTLDMLLGLTQPDSGTVTVLGDRPRQAVTAGRVSAVLQSGGLLVDLTVRETAQMIASTFSAPTSVEAVLERCGLTELAGRRVSKCSGGEQQRLRFALSLLPDPDLLVLDEPTAGMDVAARAHFWDTMHDEADAGRTVVFATHYLAEADEFADRIIMMAHGRVVADGPTETIRAQASGRMVSADLPAGMGTDRDRQRWLDRLRAIPTVVTVTEPTDARVAVTATDSDAVARALLTDLGGTNLEISSGSLEDAFMTITGGHR